MRREPRLSGWCEHALQLLLLLCAPLLLAAVGPTSPLERGRLLFVGELPNEARMVGHSELLPPRAARCSNCHSQVALRRTADEQDFAPLLGKQTLTQPRARRGGPASRYDQAALCKLLRQGIDPAHVMISQAMPRYTLTSADCEALWIFLTVQ